MRKYFNEFVWSVLCAAVISIIGYASHQVFIVVPKVEARTEKIDPMDAKLDKLLEDVSYIKGKVQ